MTELLLVHGRSQHDKDADELKAEWVDALRAGLVRAGLDLPVSENAIRFPYYGDTLRDLVTNGATVADIIIRGAGVDHAEREFLGAVMREIVVAAGITDDQLDAEYEEVDAVERAPQDWRFIRAVLRALDRHVPAVGAPSLALATRDVYLYLRNIGIRDSIEHGVREALRPGVPTVVLGHSLGSVVTYNLLRRDGGRAGWVVPLHVTVGSPLAVGPIKRSLRPLAHPTCVGAWFNARDPRDLVALNPLDPERFTVWPAVENKNDVQNDTPNRHGITGYLSDPEVASRVHAALAEGHRNGKT